MLALHYSVERQTSFLFRILQLLPYKEKGFSPFLSIEIMTALRKSRRKKEVPLIPDPSLHLVKVASTQETKDEGSPKVRFFRFRSHPCLPRQLWPFSGTVARDTQVALWAPVLDTSSPRSPRWVYPKVSQNCIEYRVKLVASFQQGKMQFCLWTLRAKE
ncbi:hypothetical protein STEG23_012631 [Scotinomys teguina]